ncbi:MAG: hypothetical protein FWC27_00395 [Firmicutes bacterium]|nr:hypothetical protein [Bacillota bacterium]
MHLILHDLSPEQAERHLPPQSETLAWLAAAPGVKPCTGCFLCWTKTPGECVIPDRGQEFCRLLAKADKLSIVSRCYYGGFSPDVKAMLDRHIGYMLPWFHDNEGEMHHIPRYERRLELAWHLYGTTTEAERETARCYCAANARNLHAVSHAVTFHGDVEPSRLSTTRTQGGGMRVAFLNGSPNKGKGVTAMLLRFLEERLPGCKIVQGWDEPCDAYVIAFPLYVDGIPSGFLRELVEHERDLPPGARVYAVVNNGFYEGGQNAAAISMVRNWCARAWLFWGQGVGIGSGEILRHMPLPVLNLFGHGSMKKFNRVLDTLAGHILAGGGGEDICNTPNFPRAPYMLAGSATFRLEGKKNGLTKREMERRLS